MRAFVCLMLWTTLTRIYAKCACSKLATRATMPTPKIMEAAHSAGRYLYNSHTFKLCFSQGPWTAPDGTVYSPNTLIGFMDTGFAQDAVGSGRISIVFMFGGAVIFSKSGSRRNVWTQPAMLRLLLFTKLLTSLLCTVKSLHTSVSHICLCMSCRSEGCFACSKSQLLFSLPISAPSCARGKFCLNFCPCLWALTSCSLITSITSECHSCFALIMPEYYLCLCIYVRVTCVFKYVPNGL